MTNYEKVLDLFEGYTKEDAISELANEIEIIEVYGQGGSSYEVLDTLTLQEIEEVLQQLINNSMKKDDVIRNTNGKSTIDITMVESTIDITMVESRIVKNGTYRGEEIVDVRIMKLHKDAIIPTYAHDTDSGMDIFAMEDVIIQPHETVAIPTGIAIALPRCYELQLRPKSGNSLKTKLRIANAPSTIDEGFRGDIGVICDNIGDTPIEIKKGKAICQGVLRFVPKISWKEVDEFTDTTDRGTGAYGSSNRGI